ncbi:GWxTD domain-containing protein [bacterium]|nr:GWxTD domain-containing protein [bacterium]
MHKIKHQCFIEFILILIMAICARAQIYIGAENYDLGYPTFNASYLYFAQSDSVRTEIYLQTDNEHLQFIKRKSYYTAHFEVQLTIFKGDTLYTHKNYQDSMVVTNYNQTRSSTPVMLKAIFFTAPPGEYRAILEFTDLDSKKNRKSSTKLKLPLFGVDEFISSLKFMKSSKSNLQTVTDKKYFAHDTTLYLYFEIYPPDSIQKLELSYLILNTEKDTIYTHSEFLDSTGNIQKRIPLNSIGPGSYFLEITIHEGKFKELKKDDFKIVWSPLFQIDQDYEEIIGQLRYIANKAEIEKLENAPDDQKIILWEAFWKAKDPTPDTDKNELKEEFYRRVDHVNDKYSGIKKGWQTDRGRIFIIYGEPDEVETHPFDIDSKPYEIWYYFQINRKFIFVDKNGINEYYLYYEE